MTFRFIRVLENTGLSKAIEIDSSVYKPRVVGEFQTNIRYIAMVNRPI